MAEGGVSLSIGVADGATPALAERLRRLEPPQLAELLDAIGGSLVDYTDIRFQQKVSPTGQRWDDYSPNTRFHPRRTSPKLLEDSGDLVRSLTSQAKPEVLVAQKSVRYGTNREYARIHQFGGMAGRGRKVRIPARPYLGVSDDDRRSIADLALAYLDTGEAT